MTRKITLNTSSGSARNESGYHLGRVQRLPGGVLRWDHHGYDVTADDWRGMALELSIAYSASVELEK